MTIPDEAVKAAAATLYAKADRSLAMDECPEVARKIIAAALPHLCLFPSVIYPSMEFHAACGECQRCDPDGLRARIAELEDGLRDALPFLGRERKEAAHPSEIARLHALLSPSDDTHRGGRMKPAPYCCIACDDALDVTFRRMMLCPKCGNKRCPRASDHVNACTGSNEPGQPGSRYAKHAQPTDDDRHPPVTPG